MAKWICPVSDVSGSISLPTYARTEYATSRLAILTVALKKQISNKKIYNKNGRSQNNASQAKAYKYVLFSKKNMHISIYKRCNSNVLPYMYMLRAQQKENFSLLTSES